MDVLGLDLTNKKGQSYTDSDLNKLKNSKSGNRHASLVRLFGEFEELTGISPTSDPGNRAWRSGQLDEEGLIDELIAYSDGQVLVAEIAKKAQFEANRGLITYPGLAPLAYTGKLKPLFDRGNEISFTIWSMALPVGHLKYLYRNKLVMKAMSKYFNMSFETLEVGIEKQIITRASVEEGEIVLMSKATNRLAQKEIEYLRKQPMEYVQKYLKASRKRYSNYECEAYTNQMLDVFPEGVVYPKGGLGFDHSVFKYGGKVYDATADQYLKFLTEQEKKSFMNQIDSGIWSNAEHDLFMETITNGARRQGLK